MDKLAQNFDRYLKINKVWPSPRRLDYSLRQFFRDLSLNEKVVLEIGAGRGLASVWCRVHGADRVVALEPEASGSRKGVKREFEKMANAIGLKGKVEYLPVTFEEYVASSTLESFDYILMQAVINHLDEQATTRLHLPEAEAQRQLYTSAFKKMSDCMKQNGVVVIYDVGRQNFWHALRLKNPFAPTIECEKHQQPKLWNELLCQCGFKFMDLRWFTPYKLRCLRFLLSYRIPTYFLNSAFILRCVKS